MRTALFLGAFAPLIVAVEAPRLAPENGTKVTKTFVNDIELELVDLQVELDGEAQEAGDVPEVKITDREEITVIDEYVKVEDGMAVELVRTFESLSDVSTQDQMGPDGIEEVTREGESELEGLSVRFKWDAEEETHVVTYADEDEAAGEELLEGLEVDADFVFLLPSGEEADEIGVGDSWELDAAVFDMLSTPSGDLKIVSEEDDEESDFEDQFRDNLEGTITATLKSIEDGVAKIVLEGEVSTEVVDDQTPDEAPEGLEVTQTYSFLFDCEGVLLWNMETGVAKSMEFGGDVGMEIEVIQAFNGNELKIMQSFEGAYSNAASFE